MTNDARTEGVTPVPIELKPCPNPSCANDPQDVIVMNPTIQFVALQETIEGAKILLGANVKALMVTGKQYLCRRCGITFLSEIKTEETLGVITPKSTPVGPGQAGISLPRQGKMQNQFN